LIVYLTQDGKFKIDVRFQGETAWLSLNQMAELFQRDKSVISRHIKNMFDEGELSPEATVAKSATVQTEGGKQVAREIEFYNLDVISSVGYRVKSQRGTQLRIWATQRLREYIVKGFTMDDERLKNPPGKGHTDYFDELLERIRDIRASERRVYLRVREILALAADYSPSEPETQVFFQTVQNKLHFAATGKTAPELIAERANSAQPNMGLTAWKSGLVRKGDVGDPALKAAGWGVVEGSKILREYPITPGRIEGHGKRGKALTADYVLVYRNRKLAVDEAKAWDKPLTEGVAQAKDYAGKLAVRFAYATNGQGIYAIDMQTGQEGEIAAYAQAPGQRGHLRLFRRAGVYLLAQGRHQRRLPHAVQGEADSDDD